MKRIDDINLYEIKDSPGPGMRLFAAYREGVLVGFMGINEPMNMMQLEYVVPEMRDKGVADALEDFARETTGLSLDQVTADLTPWGIKRVKAHGLKIIGGQPIRRIDERDIAPAVAQLAAMFAKEPKV